MRILGVQYAGRSSEETTPPLAPLILVDKHLLMDDPIRVRVSGLPPGAAVTVQATSIDGKQIIFRSSCDLIVRDDGAIDTNERAPGSVVADPYQLWWSMEPATRWFDRCADVVPTTVSVIACGRVLGSQSFDRRWRRDSVRHEQVRHGGLVGTLFTPPSESRHADFSALIILGGSDGAHPELARTAGLFASRGFLTLALAYFGQPGLPAELVDVPLEYSMKAIDWIVKRPELKTGRLGLLGISRGGELALLLASRREEIKAVGVVGSSPLLFGGLRRGSGETPVPAWKEAGSALPYREAFDPGLSNSSEALVALGDAMVPLERVAGPVLFACGDDDHLLPALSLGMLGMRRLALCGHPFRDRLVRYRGAGHGIMHPPGLPSPPRRIVHPLTRRPVDLGGSRAANALAAADLWWRLVRFFSEQLSPYPAYRVESPNLS